MVSTATSRHGVPIRLTDERWTHITEEHCELAGARLDVLETISDPARIVLGQAGELLAIRQISMDKWLIVVYREMETDGFVITAFLTSRAHSLDRRKQVWP